VSKEGGGGREGGGGIMLSRAGGTRSESLSSSVAAPRRQPREFIPCCQVSWGGCEPGELIEVTYRDILVAVSTAVCRLLFAPVHS